MSAQKPGLRLVKDTGNDEDYRLEEHVGFVLRKAHQRHLAIFTRQISDLTPPQFAALAKLHEVGATSQNQLGALIAMDAATIKGVIDRLKARGLVSLAPHEADRRRLVVSMTPAGETAVTDLRDRAHRITEETLEPLTQRERASFLKLLSKIS